MYTTTDLSIDPIGIPPHGGTLIDRQLQGPAREAALERAKGLVQIPISRFQAADLEMMAIGAYSPLTGFMGHADYNCVLEEMRLANGLIWSLPVTLSINDLASYFIKEGQEIALTYSGLILGLMTVTNKFRRDKLREARIIYGTDDVRHPGVQRLLNEETDTLLGGDVWGLNWPDPNRFRVLRKNSVPAQTRNEFIIKKWKRIAGFQTRNPIHFGHEYVFKNALEITDGLLLHPLLGKTKSDDIPAKTRLKSYKIFLEYYYPDEHTLLGVFPAPMRYAGPREAVFHALCRKNYGCTHFIVGRDHAGVGNYYDPQAAVDIFNRFSQAELGIEILSYAPTSYCYKCKGIVTLKTCPHKNKGYYLSGSEIRGLLKQGKMPPKGFMRPVISGVLLKEIFDRKTMPYYINRTINTIINEPKKFIPRLYSKLKQFVLSDDNIFKTFPKVSVWSHHYLKMLPHFPRKAKTTTIP